MTASVACQVQNACPYHASETDSGCSKGPSVRNNLRSAWHCATLPCFRENPEYYTVHPHQSEDHTTECGASTNGSYCPHSSNDEDEHSQHDQQHRHVRELTGVVRYLKVPLLIHLGRGGEGRGGEGRGGPHSV